MRTVLQVPMSRELREGAEKRAIAQGFSSLQDVVRFLLKKLAEGVLDFTVKEEATVQLSPRAIRRYNKILKDVEEGHNVYTAKNVDDLMKQLRRES